MTDIYLQADDFGRQHSMNCAIDYAIKNGLACSASLIMGSEFTEEAVDMAFSGGYIDKIHCHLNLATRPKVGNRFFALNEDFKKSVFCHCGGAELPAADVYDRIGKRDFFRKADLIFKELETQFLSFRQITKGQADYRHIDFHLYLNLCPAVAVAYAKLIRKYKIRSARFFGEHQHEESGKQQKIRSVLLFLCKHNRAYVMRSCKIEHFLTNYDALSHEKAIELYVHPDYRDGVLLDRTSSAMGKPMRPLEEHIALVRERGDFNFVSWSSFDQ